MLLNAGEPVRFTPADQMERPEGERVTYLLRVPTLWDRPKYRRAVDRHGVQAIGLGDLLAALDAALARLLAGDAEALAGNRAIVAGYRDSLTGLAEADAAGREAAYRAFAAAHRAFVEVEGRVIRADETYAGLTADRAWAQNVAGIEAARQFLVGWAGVPAEFATVPGAGAPDSVLVNVPEAHLRAIGAEVERLMQPSAAEAKNSVSPSSGSAAPTSSTAARKPRRKARSKATPGTSRSGA